MGSDGGGSRETGEDTNELWTGVKKSMKILEFGDKQKEKIILIHGLNIPWQMWNEEIEIYSRQYHVIVPVLNGYDTEGDTPFVSIEEEAKKIKEFILKKHGKSVHMIVGMSMGAAITFSIVLDGELHSDYLVFDSGVFVPTNPLLLSINNKMQLKYKNATKARNEKFLKQLNVAYGEKLAPYYMELADVMTDDNLLASSNSIGNFRLPDGVKLPNTNIIAFRGTVFMEIIAKKSTKYLKKNFSNAYIKVFNGNQHAELSIHQPKVFVEEIEKAKRIFR